MKYCCLILFCVAWLNICHCEEKVRKKRELTLQNARLIANIMKDFKELRDNLKKFKCANSNGGGSTYTRWGRTTCPSGSELIYAGIAGGSHWQHRGAASNYLCIAPNATYGNTDLNVDSGSYIYGAMYHMYKYKSNTATFIDLAKNVKGVPCAVCLTIKRPAVVMIPAIKECYPGMHKEYSGYLMSGHHVHHIAASEYVCVDGNPETTGRTVRNMHKIFNPVETVCGGALDCSIYKSKREMACVVCSK